MKVVVFVCSGYVIFVSGAGFLFGQLFFGTFEIDASLAGFCGIIGGVLAIVSRDKNKMNRIAVLCCITSLIGVLIDVYEYYYTDHVEGSYYAWFLVGPWAKRVTHMKSEVKTKIPYSLKSPFF
jgi:hypothetical protein